MDERKPHTRTDYPPEQYHALLEQQAAPFPTALQESRTGRQHEQDRFRTFFQSAPVGMLRLDLAAQIVDINPVAAQMLGAPAAELISTPLPTHLHPEDLEQHTTSWAKLLERKVSGYRLECRYRRPNDDVVETETAVWMVLDHDGSPPFVFVTTRDVTALKLLESELRAAQKLEAIGRLAAGIAHEINSPMQFVSDNTQFLRSAFEDLRIVCDRYQLLLSRSSDSIASAAAAALAQECDLDYLWREIPEAIDGTAQGALRVGSITRAMRAFAHSDDETATAANLNAALVDTLTVTRSELKYVCDVETDLGELPPVLCRLGDVNQVFLNLVVNAAHTMSEVHARTGRRGLLRVRTAVEEDVVVVSVSDTGAGIPPQHRDRLFEPFFTTKGIGNGTGYGLAFAHAVIHRHGGALTFETAVDEGTTFFVRLPINGPASTAVRVA